MAHNKLCTNCIDESIKELKNINPNIEIKEFDFLENLDWLGNNTNGWPILKNYLNKDSVVYCVGAGKDISFDEAIWKDYRSNITIIDPTKHAIKWVKQQIFNKIIEAKLIQCGLSNKDGDFNFTKFSSGDSFSLVKDINSDLSIKKDGDYFGEGNVEVKKLSTIMKENKNKKINLLKIDIEGSEYGVIDDIINEKIDIDILNVEFHGEWIPKEAFNLYKKEDLYNSIYKLHKYGLQLVWSCRSREHTFIKKELI